MKLLELDPKLTDVNGVRKLRFTCPKCRTHCFIVPSGGDWQIIGTEYHNLTVYPSIDSTCAGGCGAHFSITNGEIVWH